MLNNAVAGAQAGFMAGRSGQPLAKQQYDPNDPYSQDPSYQRQRHHGILSRGRSGGGLIHGVIGGLMGAIEGGRGNYKDTITTQSGGRQESGSGTSSPAPVHHQQETGVHTPGSHTAPAAPPPDYEPPEVKDY